MSRRLEGKVALIPGKLAALTIDEWCRVIEVSLTGTMLALQAAAASLPSSATA